MNWSSNLRTAFINVSFLAGVWAFCVALMVHEGVYTHVYAALLALVLNAVGAFAMAATDKEKETTKGSDNETDKD